jgi:adenylate kinase
MGVPRRQVLIGFLLVRFVCAQAPRKRIILMLGPPGSGKTTQSEILKSALGLPVVSMTDMLQSEGVGKGISNRNLSAQMATGDIVSDEVANSLLRKRISRKDCERGFILDGYPFTAKQAEYFEALLRELGLPRPAVIHLSITDYAVDQRLAKRGREEDSPANTELRIVMYRKQAELLMPRYPDAITVDASKPPDVVGARIRQALGY